MRLIRKAHPVDDTYHKWYDTPWLRNSSAYRRISTAPPAAESWCASGCRAWRRRIERSSGEDIKDAEFAWPIGMPEVGSLGDDLWEVRSSLTCGRVARVIFCIDNGRMVLLHGFTKKTRKTPKKDLDLALQRKKGQDE